jgi:two-component system alkaline phosphatase synthesis response regulator PhoP
MNSQILIVDDEPFMLRLIEASLKKGGFSVTACRGGEEALARAARQAPDLVILDLMMPGLDGLQTLQQLKQMDSMRDVPVIMLTAKGHKLAQVQAAEGGVAVYLTKPFSPSLLVEHARRLLATTPAQS